MSTISTSRRLSSFVLLIAILLVAALLRWTSLQEPLWLDELHTSWCVSSSFLDIAPRAMAGNQTPLYFWTVWPVYQGLGESVLGLRLVSLVASLLLVVSIGWIVFRWTGSLVGVALATGLVAIDDKFLFYAVEARPYVVVQLTAVWQVYLYAKILFPKPFDSAGGTSGGSRANLAFFWLLSNVLVWVHLSTIVLILSECVLFTGLTLWRSRDQWSRVWQVHYSSITFAGLMALIIPTLLVVALFRRRMLWEAFVAPNAYLLLTVADWLTCLAVPLLALVFCAPRHRDSWNRTGLIGALVFLGAFGPLLATWMHWVPLSDYRYTIAAATMVPLLSGVLAGFIKRNPSRLLVVAIVMGLAVTTNPLLPGLIRSGQLPDQRIEHWEEIVRTINSDGLPVCMYPNLVEDARIEKEAHRWSNHDATQYLQFAVRGIYPVYGIPEADGRVEALSLFSPQSPSNSMMERIEKSGGGWVLIRARESDARKVLEELPRWFGAKWLIEFEDFSLPPLYLFRIHLNGSFDPIPEPGN